MKRKPSQSVVWALFFLKAANPHKSDANHKIKDTLGGSEWSSKVSFISI